MQPPNFYGNPYPGYPGASGPIPGQMPNMPNGPMPMPSAPMMERPSSSPIQDEQGNMATGQAKNNGQNNPDNGANPYSYSDQANTNMGKKIRVYCSFPDSAKWHDMVFEGILYYAAEDHIVLQSLEKPDLYTFIIAVYINYFEMFEKPKMTSSPKPV